MAQLHKADLPFSSTLKLQCTLLLYVKNVRHLSLFAPPNADLRNIMHGSGWWRDLRLLLQVAQGGLGQFNEALSFPFTD
jgi:hypothetical protein